MGKSVVEMVNNRCGIDDNNEGGRDGLEAHKPISQWCHERYRC